MDHLEAATEKYASLFNLAEIESKIDLPPTEAEERIKREMEHVVS